MKIPKYINLENKHLYLNGLFTNFQDCLILSNPLSYNVTDILDMDPYIEWIYRQ